MIHPTAIIDPRAELGNNVTVGPYSVIEADCRIGDNVWIDSHVKIARYTTIGRNSRIYKGALVGEEPQDHRFKPGTVAYTLIGEEVTLREYVTIHRSPFEGEITSVGDGTLLMAFCHVGHDAKIGNYVTAANHTAFSGHVIVHDRAVLSGYVLIHQFCRIGKLAMIGGRTIIRQDVPPFCMLAENETVCGPNVVGLRRAGFDSDRRLAVKNAIRSYFFRGLNSSNALALIAGNNPGNADIEEFIAFIKASERGIMPGDPALIALGTHALEE